MAKFQMTNKWLILVVLLITASCSPYQRLLKSDDVMLKKEKAIMYYEKGDYTKALTLLDDIIPAFRGTAHAEQLNYYYAYAHYHQRDYILAAHYFKTFTQGFPRSEHVEEFLYMSAYCKYLLSPRPSLDQTETQDAIRELQSFINRFPNSARVEQSNQLIDELRLKLEKKAFESAVLYFNIRDYTAAVTAFNNVIRGFPDTEFREESLFYIIRSHFLFAENSVETRQLERYQNVVAAHARLMNRFPESRFKTEADRMLSIAQNRIASLNNNGQESSAQNNN
jgi:outer membrane protein assembly factor BamD